MPRLRYKRLASVFYILTSVRFLSHTSSQSTNPMPPLLLRTRVVRFFHSRLPLHASSSSSAISAHGSYIRKVLGMRTDDSRTTADPNRPRNKIGSKPKSASKRATDAPSQASFDSVYVYPPVHRDVGSKPSRSYMRDLTAISFSPFGFTLPILISRL
jgi:hypothetical protein